MPRERAGGPPRSAWADGGDGEGILLVVAHPDDEVIGAGGLLQRAARAYIVRITDGAPADGDDARAAGFPAREAYAAARRREAAAALAMVGLREDDVCELGAVDQRASHE